jgi:hypothetical protein
MERILYYTGERRTDEQRLALENALKLAYAQRENAELKALLNTAQERLLDMLKMDDGQAFSEADKFVKRLDVYLEDKKKLDVV